VPDGSHRSQGHPRGCRPDDQVDRTSVG
jgi:hypothetical protein